VPVTRRGDRLKQALLAPRLESLFVATMVLFGFRLGARPIGDNSMFTHLRTGVEIVRSGHIPRTDPYSYTAGGEPWVVQSWLAEATYGLAYRVGGLRLVVFEQAVLLALLVWLVLRLARAGSPVRTALAGGTAVGVGAALWTPRPLLFGLICMALTILIVERRKSPWLLVPVVWVWVSSHGSFPLGLVWIAARFVGEGLEVRAWPRDAWRYVAGFLAGLGVAVINPLGLKLLAFPLTLGEKREAFENIVEWRSPDFSRAGGHFVLVFLAVALVLLLRAPIRWRDIVPVVGFLIAGLLAARNIGVLGVVLAPALGRALRRPEVDEPEVAPALAAREPGPLPPGASPSDAPQSDAPPSDAPPPGADPSGFGSRVRINRAILALILAAFVVFAASTFNSEPLDLVGYPEDATRFLDDEGLLAAPHRLAHQDFIGNYLTLRRPEVPVFVDDRFDMYPLSVSSDYEALLSGRGNTLEILDRWKVDVVLWQPKLPLVPLLRALGWRETFADEDWIVLQR
jgi:hypothetical protein